MPASADAPAQKATWNPELNNPSPNMTYIVDGNVTIKTDHLARTMYLRAEDVEFHETPDADARRHGGNQSEAGKLGGSNYDGGHFLAAMFGGPGERLNLFPQWDIQNRNNGLRGLTPEQRFEITGNEKTWYDLENELRRKLKESGGNGINVTWEAKPVYKTDGPVPEWVKLNITVNGESEVHVLRNVTNG
jgi:hypothetical protein